MPVADILNILCEYRFILQWYKKLQKSRRFSRAMITNVHIFKSRCIYVQVVTECRVFDDCPTAIDGTHSVWDYQVRPVMHTQQ